jgi:sigma-B regulation protein RsbU (phosphoserine phosphatase)
VLQAALLPEVPGEVGLLRTSVAYRPAEGPGAGGDFYDAFELDGGRVGIVLGDMAGHGHEALAQTTLLRYTLRVYLETGLDPRTALKLAGRTFDESLEASFATAVVALYDAGEGTLTYACAGHPPPVLLGPPWHEPVTVSSSPPIGIGAPTGLRQTKVPLPSDALACFFTDGLTEARLEHGLLGRARLVELLDSLGPDATAATLLARIREEAAEAPDDMAACIVRPVADSVALDVRVEELELGHGEPIEPAVERFLEACGVTADELPALRGDASSIASRWGGVLVRVRVADAGAEASLSAPHVNALAGAAL